MDRLRERLSVAERALAALAELARLPAPNAVDCKKEGFRSNLQRDSFDVT